MSLPQMSLSGAVMIVVIVVIRALAIHRLPKKTFLALWGVALVRLLVPYSLPSAFSVYSIAKRLAPAAEAPKDLPVFKSYPSPRQRARARRSRRPRSQRRTPRYSALTRGLWYGWSVWLPVGRSLP